MAPPIPSRRLGGISLLYITGGGIALLLLALGWWWLVFSKLIVASALPLSQAVPCLAIKSDVCSLAEALCAKPHWLAINRYSSEAFWGGLILLLAAPFLKVAARQGD
jgi:hypothetical protein